MQAEQLQISFFATPTGSDTFPALGGLVSGLTKEVCFTGVGRDPARGGLARLKRSRGGLGGQQGGRSGGGARRSATEAAAAPARLLVWRHGTAATQTLLSFALIIPVFTSLRRNQR